MKITSIEAKRHQNRVDLDITLEDGTKCTYIPNTPPAPIPGVVVSDGDLAPGQTEAVTAAAQAWIEKNQATIAELLAR